MIQQRNNEEGMAPVAKKKGAKGSSSSGGNSGSASGLSNIQLVFRGMLGCVRVEVARCDSSSAGNSSTGSSSNGTSSKSQPSVGRVVVSSSSAREAPMGREREREQAALCYNVHGIFYSAFEREHLLESDKKDTEDSDRHTTLGKITKKFMKLLMNLQKETSCKDACPIIVAMFTEIMNALSGAAKLTGKYIYMYIYICVYIYMYIYTYIYTKFEKLKLRILIIN
jgi:hypothetical protein